jgi:hypothetical protein
VTQIPCDDESRTGGDTRCHDVSIIEVRQVHCRNMPLVPRDQRLGERFIQELAKALGLRQWHVSRTRHASHPLIMDFICPAGRNQVIRSGLDDDVSKMKRI